MRKSVFVITTFVCMAAASLAFYDPEPVKYQNLKVLPKNTNKHDMDSLMHLYSSSLGVRCGFCHVRNEEEKKWNFASDENKHKLVAREMMKMTDKINEKYFEEGRGTNQLVTCYSCHHGEENPARFAPPKEEASAPAKTEATKQ